MKHGNWIDSLRDMERGYEQEAPPGLLDSVMEQLPRRRRARRVAAWLRVGAVAAAACVALLIGTPLLTRHGEGGEAASQPGRMAANVQKKLPEGSSVQVSSQGQTASSQGQTAMIAANIGTYGGENRLIPTEKQPEESAVLPSPASDNAVNPEKVASAGSKAEPAAPKKQPGEPAKTVASSMQPAVPGEADYAAPRRRRSRLMASLFASGTGSRSNGSSEDMVMLNDAYYGINENGSGQTGGQSASATRKAKRSTPTAQTQGSHDIPLRFGLTVQLGLTDRIGIESGLVYTRLGSDIDMTAGTSYAQYRQTLHYIGVPLRVSYALWQSDRFCFYLKCGAMAEKLVASSIETRGASDRPEKPEESQLQLSVGASVGASARIAGPVHLFVEPGVSHYFGNSSSLCSLYKDRPTAFEVSLGIRLGL